MLSFPGLACLEQEEAGQPLHLVPLVPTRHRPQLTERKRFSPPSSFLFFFFLLCVGSFLDVSRKGKHEAIAVWGLVMRRLAVNACRTAEQRHAWFTQSLWPLGTKVRLEVGRGDRGQEHTWFEAQCDSVCL